MAVIIIPTQHMLFHSHIHTYIVLKFASSLTPPPPSLCLSVSHPSSFPLSLSPSSFPPLSLSLTLQSTPTPPPTAPKTARSRPPAGHQGSLRMAMGGGGGGVASGGATGPETVLDSTPGGKSGVSQKIQQLLNTLKRPKKNRRPIEEYYQDQTAGYWSAFCYTCTCTYTYMLYIMYIYMYMNNHVYRNTFQI